MLQNKSQYMQVMVVGSANRRTDLLKFGRANIERIFRHSRGQRTGCRTTACAKIVCQKLGCAPSSAFKDLLEEYNVELKGPFNYSAHDEAGIPRDWYDLSTNNKDMKRDNSEKLSEVYERLASIISMENENLSLNRR
ncbi:hypothetical protein ACLB2K_055742 [Fragaria x ananassa]